MKVRYNEYSQLNLPAIGKEVLKKWEENNAFEKSIDFRQGKQQFVFYEGPPSANGMPGIHHVISRTLKDLVCRYKTMKGYQVKRKGGWDTHGLPIELGVEKLLGITKEDIGKKISVEEYNAICRREVLKFKDKWAEITKQMGYWVDLEHPYITFENNLYRIFISKRGPDTRNSMRKSATAGPELEGAKLYGLEHTCLIS